MKLPFTFEIIMCLTLNSAAEWAGSMFQVVVAGVAVAADVVVCVVVGIFGFAPFPRWMREETIRCNKYFRTEPSCTFIFRVLSG